MPRLALIVLVGVCAVAAGCGGGGGGGNGGTAGALSKDEFASKVSNLCLLADDQVHELHMTNSIIAWKNYGDRVVKIGQSFIDKVGALKAPDEIKGAVQEYLDANKKVVEDLRTATADAKKNDRKGMLAALAQGNKDNDDTWPPAKEIGAKSCYPSSG